MNQIPACNVTKTSSKVLCDVVLVTQSTQKKGLLVSLKAYQPLVDQLCKEESFEPKPGNTVFVRLGGKGKAQNVLFVACNTDNEKLRQAGSNVFSKLSSEKMNTAALHMDVLKNLDSEATRSFLEGFFLTSYSFEKYFTSKKPDKTKLKGLSIVTSDQDFKKITETAIKDSRIVAEAVNITRDWSNEPSNVGTPEYYATQSKLWAKKLGLNCKILTEKDAAKEGMGLFLGVGQGSEQDGYIVVLEYNPPKRPGQKTLCLVGKGVTFDSGGISIKPSARMEEMKHDMTGAATVMGAMMILAERKIKNRVVGIMAFTENMPSGCAINPGNILTSRAGKTVEVINTDAEGRLILADVLDYAHEFKPDAIVNIATLTGAVGIALGKQCCAVLGNNDAFIAMVQKSGAKNGEKIWQLPLFDEYFEDMKSNFADMRNSCNDSAGGTIRGGIFLKQFIKKGIKWAHLDVASTVWGVGHLPYFPKNGANGQFVRTLAQVAQDF